MNWMLALVWVAVAVLLSVASRQYIDHHTRRLCVGTLYMQWARGA